MAAPDIPATLPNFANRFATKDACGMYLFDLRWPAGFVCPKCGHKKGFFIKGRLVTECGNRACVHQSSLTAGTILHGTRQNLRTWFWAVYLVNTLTPGISALKFQEQLGIVKERDGFYHVTQTTRGTCIARLRATVR